MNDFSFQYNSVPYDPPSRKVSPPHHGHKIKPPSAPSSSPSSLSRQKRVNIQSPPQIRDSSDYPKIAESPAVIFGNRFDNMGDEELKNLIKKERKPQNTFISPFGDVTDDDDLVVPSCAKKALDQEKMKKSALFTNTPPFLIGDDSDDDSDLVIPTCAKEMLLKKHEKEKNDEDFSDDFEESFIDFSKNDIKSESDEYDGNKSRMSLSELGDSNDEEEPRNSKKRKNWKNSGNLRNEHNLSVKTENDSYDGFSDSEEISVKTPDNQYFSDDSDDLNSTIGSNVSYKPTRTPTRKKTSVFASADSFPFTEASFKPFVKKPADVQLLSVPSSPMINRNIEDYKVDDEEEEKAPPPAPPVNPTVSMDSPPLPILNIFNDDSESGSKQDSESSKKEGDLSNRIMLEIKMQDALLNIDMVTKKWEGKIDEEKKNGEMRVQQLKAKQYIETQRHTKSAVSDTGAKIFIPTINLKKADLGERMSNELKILIEENRKNVEIMEQSMMIEIEKQKAKLESLKSQYAALTGNKVPMAPMPPADRPKTRPRRNTSRVMRAPPTL